MKYLKEMRKLARQILEKMFQAKGTTKAMAERTGGQQGRMTSGVSGGCREEDLTVHWTPLDFTLSEMGRHSRVRT